MRLSDVDRGRGVGAKALFALIRVVSGEPAPDVVRTLRFRPELFGAKFSATVQRLLRGPSEWSVGERELFASYTSRLNACHF